jgi:hypothetical protein
MSFKLLVDECLSPDLVEMAIAMGHVESTCVRNRGWLGLKDHQLVQHVVAEDFTLVTHNARDFRGPVNAARTGLHARQAIHAGLVCLNSVFPMGIDRQRVLFDIALAELALVGDLINQALEVFEMESGAVEVVVYSIPGNRNSK